MLTPGNVTPDFLVFLHTGQEFRLNDACNPHLVVLHFYPGEFTIGFPLGSDPERVRPNGAAAKQETYVTDREGIIRLAAHHEVRIGSYLREVRIVLGKLQDRTATLRHDMSASP